MSRVVAVAIAIGSQPRSAEPADDSCSGHAGPSAHGGSSAARARATRRFERAPRRAGAGRARGEARRAGLPDGLEVEWLGVSGYRLSYEGKTLFIDPYLSRVPLRRLLLRRPTLPDPAALDRFVKAPGEVVGVLVGHTHFDHAVDAPAIARRFGCRAYGSDSLVALMGLHGLAEQAVEVEPYRTYELGPFEVSFTPSVHSKLLLGPGRPLRRRPHLRAPRRPLAGAYRCGQVWGISIEVAGMRFYHQGSANLIDDAIRETGRRRLPRRGRRPQLHPRLLEADPPPPQPPHRRPHPLRQLLPAARPEMEFVANVQLSELPEEIGAVSSDIEVAALPRSDLA